MSKSTLVKMFHEADQLHRLFYDSRLDYMTYFTAGGELLHLLKYVALPKALEASHAKGLIESIATPAMSMNPSAKKIVKSVAKQVLKTDQKLYTSCVKTVAGAIRQSVHKILAKHKNVYRRQMEAEKQERQQ